MSELVNGMEVVVSKFLVSQGNDDVEIGIDDEDSIVFRFHNAAPTSEDQSLVRFSTSSDHRKLYVEFNTDKKRFTNRYPIPIESANNKGQTSLYLNYSIECVGAGQQLTRIVGYTLLRKGK